MRNLLTALWQPGHFYIGPGLRCAWQFEAEQTLPWEIFRGQLVRVTREQRTFLAWNLLPVSGGELGEPLLSLLLDDASIHVTRGLECRVWKPVDSAEGIVSEQSAQWTRELVGTVCLKNVNRAGEVETLVRQAIVGASRLPLTSLEAPLPQFTFGQLMYRQRPLEGVDPRMPRRAWRELLPLAGDAKVLEAILRTTDDIVAVAAAIADEPDIVHVFRRMFNEVSLSPYTDFVDRALALLARRPEEVETLVWLTRRIARHLTAYDLVLFHYRGANYPDALLLDALTRRLIVVASERSRSALRLACLLRSHYEGHAVPDRPTSPGENERVLPQPYHVPEEQIHESARRSRRLYTEAPLADLLTAASRHELTMAIRDLADPAELQEGGMALFIDRPLGFFKPPAEVDRTPLISYECFSRRLATRRLIEAEQLSTSLGLDVPAEFWEQRRRQLAELSVSGLSLDRIPDSPRPAVSLADARKVSDDFVVLRTTPGSLRAFWNALGVTPGDWPLVARIVHDSQPTLAAFDVQMRPVWLFDADWSEGSVVNGGIETPRLGVSSRPEAVTRSPRI